MKEGRRNCEETSINGNSITMSHNEKEQSQDVAAASLEINQWLFVKGKIFSVSLSSNGLHG